MFKDLSQLIWLTFLSKVGRWGVRKGEMNKGATSTPAHPHPISQETQSDREEMVSLIGKHRQFSQEKKCLQKREKNIYISTTIELSI